MAPLTTNLGFRKHAIAITSSNLESGHLVRESLVKVDRVLSVKQDLVRKVIGRVKPEILVEAKKLLARLVE